MWARPRTLAASALPAGFAAKGVGGTEGAGAGREGPLLLTWDTPHVDVGQGPQGRGPAERMGRGWEREPDLEFAPS